MTYATLEKQIRRLPEDCIDEVASFVEYLIYRQDANSTDGARRHPADHFGVLKGLKDGLAFQKELRSEWN